MWIGGKEWKMAIEKLACHAVRVVPRPAGSGDGHEKIELRIKNGDRKSRHGFRKKTKE